MTMKRCVLVLAIAVAGCGDSGGGGPGIMNSPYPSCPTCMHAQYVVGPKTTSATDHGITVPSSNAQAAALGCDINNDGETDNQLGKVLSALKAAANNVDVQTAVDDSFSTGGINVLFDIEFDPAITDTTTAGIKGFIGAHDASDGKTCSGTGPCDYYLGGGKFTVTSGAGGGFGG
jgi:hypothetical protein